MKRIVWIGLIPLATYLVLDDRLTIVQRIVITTLGAIVIWVIAVAFSTGRFACPRCGKGLFKVPRGAARDVAAKLKSQEGLGACPHCGASFDVSISPQED